MVSFGDPTGARVATLSLNPSWIEFQDQSGAWLLGEHRRLASLRSLGVTSAEELTDEHVGEVVNDCYSYFDRPTWYKRWFGWLEKLLSGAGVGSYLDGSACHLDLVQWATKPAQGKLDPGVWRRLVSDDRAFLEWQLGARNIDVVLMNGAAIIAEVRASGIAPDLESSTIRYKIGNGTGEVRVVRGRVGGKLFLGWNRPLATAIARSGREALIAWVRESADGLGVGPSAGTAAAPASAVELVDGFIRSIHRVASVNGLEAVLRRWYERSDQPTVGDVAGYGGSPVIAVHTADVDFVLNRDTKRSAVGAFLNAAERAGAAELLDWWVVPGSRGGFRRVSYVGNAPTPGWYAYLRKAERGARRLSVGVRPTPAPSTVLDESVGGRRAVAPVQVVQFVHPGFEYHRTEHVGRRHDRQGVMAWKPGRSRHDRKFLVAEGSLLDLTTGVDHSVSTIAFWGEWEPPSVYWRLDSPGSPLPSIVHAPFLPEEIPGAPVQNTDPLVFGNRFVYSNCLQRTYAALQRLALGSIVLFGRFGKASGRPSFELDTCLVVDRSERVEPQPFAELWSDLLTDAVLGPLHTELEQLTTFTVYSGRVRDPSGGPFSFVPARQVSSEVPLFARPRLEPVGALDGVINPANMQGIRLTRNVANDRRDAIWQEVVRQVAAQGCGLAYRVGTPPVIGALQAISASKGPPCTLRDRVERLAPISS